MLRPPHSAEKGTGDDGMLCAECSGERARATTACSAQSAQGRTSHRIGNGAEVGCVDRSTGAQLKPELYPFCFGFKLMFTPDFGAQHAVGDF